MGETNRVAQHESPPLPPNTPENFEQKEILHVGEG